MPGGRPEVYTKELGEKICEQIALGYSLRTITSDKSMPCIATIYSWIRKDEEFLKLYEQAKEDQADAMAEEMLDIADDGTNDWVEKCDPNNPGYAYNGEHVQRSRLRVDTRKWIAAKLKPKKYGDKQTTEITGKDGAPLLNTEEAARTIAFLLSTKE